jgi:thiol:disulfide interchange protein DsbC
MNRIFSFFAITILLFPVSYSFGFATKGQDCSKCHTLKKDEASTLLKNFDQNIKVLNINKSTAKYLWEVSIESNGKKGLVYIDLPKKHLFSGSLIEIKGKKNLTQERLSEINRVNVSRIPLKDALVMGDKNARHKVIVFDDPD